MKQYKGVGSGGLKLSFDDGVFRAKGLLGVKEFTFEDEDAARRGEDRATLPAECAI